MSMGDGNIKSINTNYARGVLAEQQAAEFLRSQGYEILRARYKTKYGEIDLITRKENILCFVEVKCRQRYSDALDAVTSRTQKRIENSALIFLSENPDYLDYDMRFDVVALSEDLDITHLDNAWEARS